MKLFYRRDKIKIFLVFLIFLLINGIGWLNIDNKILIFSTSLLAAMVTLVGFGLYRKIVKEFRNLYDRVDALVSIYSMVKPPILLPRMNSYVVSSDIAHTLMSLVNLRKPHLMVDLGSGLSTILSAYSLKQNGSGRIISIDHDENYAQITENNLRLMDLIQRAEIIHAPLKELNIKDKTINWYNPEFITKIRDSGEKVDIVFVDGPPNYIQDFSRFPALPLLYPVLAPNAVIVVDDLWAGDMKQTVNMWLEEFVDFECEFIDNQKGAAILRRQNSE